MSATGQEEDSDPRKTTRTYPNDGSTKQLADRDQAPQHQSKDDKSKVLVSTTSHHEEKKPPATRTSPASAPMSAAAVNAVMGPPPPKGEKTGSRWERWRRDRKEARELGMPSHESSGRWKVKNFAA